MISTYKEIQDIDYFYYVLCSERSGMRTGAPGDVLRGATLSGMGGGVKWGLGFLGEVFSCQCSVFSAEQHFFY